MTTKTVSLDHDTYEMLANKRRGRETISQVVRRLVTDCPALTVEELEEAMKPFIGIGAGRKAKPRHKMNHRHALA